MALYPTRRRIEFVMDEARTISWIMCALALASQREPANFAAISMVADGINHAKPTHKELQSSLRWLVGNSLVRKQGSHYSLTEHGMALMETAHKQGDTTFQVWTMLTDALRLNPGSRCGEPNR